ncbi:glycosyltransferase family 4 protein [candidate division TA06 bacterium]|uniref:Glycosyltransferase family 4 protein n=1 Tax=candidate division TA06 bacterium TaxID=2250710 RepID=A0A933I9A4_UNCT6|nr:glycosyltransferase family 4 protein [candidate division TA06 bacterium]
MKIKDKKRLAFLATHPIQYQAPLLRRIAKEEDIDLTVYFCSDLSVRGYKDPGFGKKIAWDTDLLSGYSYEFLPIVDGNNSVTTLRPFNYGLLKRLKKKNIDAIFINGYARWYNLWVIIQSKSAGIKVLIRDEATPISARRNAIKKMLKRIFFQLLNKLCDGFMAIGTLNRQYYLQNGIPAEKIFMMPYAVDNDYFRHLSEEAKAKRQEFARELGVDSRRPVILYASKLTQRKRAQDLLDAYILLSPDGQAEPDPYLLVIGEGEARAFVEEKARARGWNSIKFLGFKNQSELPAYFELCDVFVLPSVYEPWGLVVNEAMSAGRAVIVSDQAGCGPDLVQDGRNGFIFKAGDIWQLSEALKKITGDRELARSLGMKSREIIGSWGIEQDIVGLRKAMGLKPGVPG